LPNFPNIILGSGILMSYLATRLPPTLRWSILVLSLFFPVNAISVTFNVDSLVDGVDSEPGDGACVSLVGGLCTLRAAIQETNALASNDTIILGVGKHMLTIRGAEEDAAATGDLDITGGGNLTIIGAGIDDTIIEGAHPSGNRFGLLDRILHILPAAGTVALSQLTAGGGWLTGENGGGLYNSGPNTILNDVEISDNNAIALLDFDAEKEQGTGSARSTFGIGGGIFNDTDASLLLDRSRVIYNASQNSNFFDMASLIFSGGGGIRNLGHLEIRNQSRIEYNTAMLGGGIGNTGTAKITDTIVMFNSANRSFGTGGGLTNHGGVLTIRRSYIGQNYCFSCDGGGIANHPAPGEGIVTILESAIDNNSAQLAIGGGVSNFSTMYIGHSSVSWNGVDGLGAGISNGGNAKLIVENTTMVGNTSNSLGAYGAGIHTSSGMTLNHVTLTANHVKTLITPDPDNFAQELYLNTRNLSGDGGDGNFPSGPVIIKNSIIGDEAYRRKLFLATGQISEAAAALDSYCGGGYSENDGIGGSLVSEGDNVSTDEYLSLIKSEGYNVSNGATCALLAGGDQTGTAPNLLDAGAYGGATLPPGPFLPNPISRPPAATSAVRDLIPVNDCAPQIDQRVFARPSGGACDAGAAEYGDLVAVYADLDLSATAEPGVVIARGQPILYKLVIKNQGPSVSNDLSGSALVTNFELSGMTLTDSSFIAPDGVGEVSCTSSNNAPGTTQWADCSFDSPLMPDTELIIFLTLATDDVQSRLRVKAQIQSNTTPDPFDYNNQITLNHRVSPDVPLLVSAGPPAEAVPITSGGIMSLYEIFIATILVIIFAFFRANSVKSSTRLNLSHKLGLSSAIFLCITSSYAAVPTITSITPSTGAATNATIVTITGTGFDANVKVGLLNDPEVSSVITRVEPTDAFYVEKQNNLLYLSRNVTSSSSQMNIYDVTDPTAPILQLERFRLPARAIGGRNAPNSHIRGLAARPDNTLFISSSVQADNRVVQSSLMIYDFNNPSAPVLKRNFAIFTYKNGKQTTLGSIKELENDLLYRFGGGISIIDTSITTGANVIGSIPGFLPVPSPYNTDLITVPTSNGPRKFFLVAGNRITIDIAGAPTEGELLMYDVTDPTNPFAVYAANGPPRQNFFPDRIVDVAVKLLPSGSVTKVYAIVTSLNGFQVSGAGLHVYDVGPDTGFTNLNPIGSYHGLGNFNEIYINGDVVTALDLNLDDAPQGYRYYDFDISDPTTPKLIGGPYMVGQGGAYYPWHSRVSDGYIYASGGFIYKRNPPITITNVTATTITATIPAGYIPQLFDLVVTNSAGETEEVIFTDAFTVQ